MLLENRMRNGKRSDESRTFCFDVRWHGIFGMPGWCCNPDERRSQPPPCRAAPQLPVVGTDHRCGTPPGLPEGGEKGTPRSQRRAGASEGHARVRRAAGALRGSLWPAGRGAGSAAWPPPRHRQRQCAYYGAARVPGQQTCRRPPLRGRWLALTASAEEERPVRGQGGVTCGVCPAAWRS